jgi:hypothetical protein
MHKKNTLKPCPWCKKEPIFLQTNTGHVEVFCNNKMCRARPMVSVGKNYTKEQVIVVWNSYDIRETPQKTEIRDLSKFREYISKKELHRALYDAMCSEHIWEKYLPDIKYMQKID